MCPADDGARTRKFTRRHLSAKGAKRASDPARMRSKPIAAGGSGAVILRQASPRPAAPTPPVSSAARWRLFCSQMISVEPPPMSNTSAPLYLRPISGAQPTAARSASSSAEITSRSMPASSRARRHQHIGVARPAAPPGWRWRAHGATLCLAMRSAQIFSAAMVRSMAASDSRPVWPTPSPSRTMREKESTTRKPPAARRPRRRSAGGNCWCPDPAPPAAERRSPVFLRFLAIFRAFLRHERRSAARGQTSTAGAGLGEARNRPKTRYCKGLACKGQLARGAAGLNGRSRRAARPVGGSSNGRTADSDSACLGSNPSPPANSPPKLR